MVKIGRKFLFVVLLVAVTLVSQAISGRAEPVNIGIPTIGFSDFPAVIALKKGFFKEEGLEPRMIIIKTGLQIGALMAGELDYSTVVGQCMRAGVKGLPIKVIMGMFDKPSHMVIGRASIKKFSDLRGKRVGISTFGSSPHIMFQEALKERGMTDKDVQFITIGGSSARFAALRAGSIDAAPLDIAYLDKTEKLGFSKVLYLGDVVAIPVGGYGVWTQKIKRNPDQIRRMIRASLKGMDYMKNNKQGTLEIMRDHLRISKERGGDIYEFVVRSMNNGIIDAKSVGNEIRLAKVRVNVKGKVPHSQVVDWSLVKEVLGKK